MTSRDTRDIFMPGWFMETPSETEMVVNSRGVPPASTTPFCAALD